MELYTVDGNHSDIRAIVRIQPSTRPEAMIESVDTDRSKREEDQVSFGFESVSPDEKTRKVGDVFKAVAGRYDLMNDLMSLGTHRLFKRMVLQMSGVREGYRVLDLAGGTGDMAALFAPAVGEQGRVILTDLNRPMMQVGRNRLLDRGLSQVQFCQAPAEALPFADADIRLRLHQLWHSQLHRQRSGAWRTATNPEARCTAVGAGIFQTHRSGSGNRLPRFSGVVATRRQTAGG